MDIICITLSSGETLASILALITMLISGLCWIFKLASSVKVIEVQNEASKESQAKEYREIKTVLEKNNRELKELIIDKNNELRADMNQKLEDLNQNIKDNDALTAKLDKDILLLKKDRDSEKEGDQLDKLIDVLSNNPEKNKCKK